MGKGGGCVPSKKKFASSSDRRRDRPSTPPAPIDPSSSSSSFDSVEVTNTTTTTANGGNNIIIPDATVVTTSSYSSSGSHRKQQLRLYIVYYSMYGHVETLARRMKKGADSVEGVEALLYRVPETLSREVLESMKAPRKDESVPEMIDAKELVRADGVLFGFPTRYGSMAAQMKAFFDSTGGSLWKEQKLAGKPAGFFVSTGTQGGGQETTAWTAITQLAHHGMLFVPVGYTFGAGMFKMDSIRGGSPYGAGVYAGDGTRVPTDTELALAEHQGNYMAAVVKRLCHNNNNNNH